MAAAKVRRTVTLDRDRVEFVSGDPLSLSTVVNAALRAVKDRTERQVSLDSHVADLIDTFGEPDPKVRAVAEVFDRAGGESAPT